MQNTPDLFLVTHNITPVIYQSHDQIITVMQL